MSARRRAGTVGCHYGLRHRRYFTGTWPGPAHKSAAPPCRRQLRWHRSARRIFTPGWATRC